MSAVFQILTVAAAVCAIFAGFRKGFWRQLGSVAGIIAGILADHAFHEPLMRWNAMPAEADPMSQFARGVLISALLFLTFYMAIAFAAGIVTRLMRLLPSGVLGSIAGSLWCLFKWMFMLSLCMNLYLGFSGNADLLKCGCDGDGNLAGGVLRLAPVFLACDGVGELGHTLQLEDAKKISQRINDTQYNFNDSLRVMPVYGAMTRRMANI